MAMSRILLAAGCCVAAASLSACKSNEKPEESAASIATEPLSTQESIEGSVSARVAAIDHVRRLMTLTDEAGLQQSFTVSDAVQRLSEVQVGDYVTARYKATLVAELRPPTADEQAHPIAAVEVAGRAPVTDRPAASAVQGIRVVTTVEAVDVPNMRVTLRGPLQNLAVVKGKKKENLERIRVGDTIVITYTESVAVSLQKAAPTGR